MKHSRLVWIVGILAVVLAIPVLGSRAPRTDRPSTDAAQAQRGQGQRAQAGQPRTAPLPPERWSWWRDESVQADLALTSEQVERLEAMFQERRAALGPFIQEFGRLLRETEAMARERSATPEEFALKISALENLRAKLNESRTVMLYRMKLEVTEEQYAKLQEIRDQRARGGRRSSDRERRPE